MAFEALQVQSTVSGVTVVGYREDLDSYIGDTVTVQLTSQIGVSSYEWSLIGRPEGSSAGGTGPEPIFLGTGLSASFVVDSDSPYPRDGMYVVQCRINAGAPNETVKTAGLVRLSALTTADGRTLRMIGGFETFEDTSDPLVRQGWCTMVNRWFRVLASGAGAGGGGSADEFHPAKYHVAYPERAIPSSQGISIANPQNRLWAYPRLFRRAGTVTDIGTTIFATGVVAGVPGHIVMAIYRPDPTAPLVNPGTLVWSQEFLAPNDNSGMNNLHATPNITASAGEVLWFVCNIDQGTTHWATDSTGILCIPTAFAPANAVEALGLDWIPASVGTPPTLTFAVGYRQASTYASVPPLTYPGGSTPTRVVAGSSGDGSVPVLLFKYVAS